MARAQPIPELGPDIPLREAAARTIEVRAREVFSFADAALDTSDIEGVHDMRVATRRLRAALEVYAPCFPKAEFKQLLREVKALADALGARRDPDVALVAVEKIERGLTAADQPGVESFASELRAEQAAANGALEAALAEVVDTQLEARLLALAAEAHVT